MVKAKKKKQIHLKHPDKLAIVRDEMVKFPRVAKYGYNRELISRIRKKYNVRLSDKTISILIKEVNDTWDGLTAQVIGRRKLLEMWLQLYDDCNKIDTMVMRIKRKCEILEEIGKLEKHYETVIKTTHGIEGLDAAELRKLLKGLDE